MELWDDILSSIEKKISYQNFDIWFKPTTLERQDREQKRLLVRVPNTHFKYWLAENYSEVIEETLAEFQLDQYQVSFVAAKSPGQSEGEPRWAAGLKEPCADASRCHLNTNYTFSRFVVGFCNQFAHAASVAVAEQPAKAYNPFFIYGGVGLGKTHLMHAVGHCIKAQSPQMRLTYMSSEQFMKRADQLDPVRQDDSVSREVPQCGCAADR